jgi:hypothetical protein
MYLDSNLILNQDYYETVKDISTCIICTGIIIEPIQCSTCENCFCKNCINMWLNNSKTCPFKCSRLETKEASRLVKNMMSKLMFKCPLNSCDNHVPYEDILQHEGRCGNENAKCPLCKSQVRKCELIERRSIDELRIELEIMKKINEELRVENEQLKKGENQKAEKTGLGRFFGKKDDKDKSQGDHGNNDSGKREKSGFFGIFKNKKQ